MHWYRPSTPEIPLTPNLEILSMSPKAVQYLKGPTPATLRIIILQAIDSISPDEVRDIQEFFAGCNSVTGLALVDSSRFFHLVKIYYLLK
jgi:hypothetical protein